MGFLAFVYLLVIGVVVALVLANLPKLKIKLPGGLTTAIIVGYIGARFGTFLFGNWPFLTLQGVSILPAILGAIGAVFLAKACVECCKK